MAEPAGYVQPPAYTADGKPIAPEALPDALAAGQAFFPKGSRVFARNDRGDLISVDASEVNKPNLRILTPDEVSAVQEHKEYGKGVGNMAKAAAAGAARTLTLGGSDVAARAIGGSETAHALQALREQNPISSAGGEIAGAVAPLLLTGGGSAVAEGLEGAELAAGGAEGAELAEGAGAAAKSLSAAQRAARAATVVPRTIAKAGHLVEHGVEHGLRALGYEGTTLAGRVGAGAAKLAAGGGVEGGLYGAQGAISEQALNDHNQTVENLVAGMGHGALLGAALGGGIGTASELGSYTAGKLLGKEGEALEGLAQRHGLRSIGTQREIQKLGGRAVGEAAEEKISATADDLLKTEVKTGPKAGQRLLEKGDSAADIAEKASIAKTEIGAQRRAIMEQIDAAQQQASKVGALDGLENFGQDLDQEAAQNAAKHTAAPSVPDFVEQVRGSDWYQQLKNSKPLRSQFRSVDRELSMLNPADEDSFLKLDNWRRELREKFQPPTPTGGGLPPQPPKSAKYLEKLERSMGDYLDGKATETLRSMGENADLYSDLTRKYSSLSQIQSMAQKTVNRGNRILSPSDQGLGAAGFLASVISGHPLVGALAGGAASIANNLLRTRGNSVIAGLARDATEMEGTLERTAHHLADKTVEGTGILASLGGSHERARGRGADTTHVAAGGAALREQYQTTIARVRELAAPEATGAHVSALAENVTHQYPEVGAAASRKLLSLYQHLQQGIPTPASDPRKSLTPRAVQERVPPTLMADYLSRVRGATDPRAVLADLGRGQIDRTALDTVKELYPKTFDRLRARATELVASRDKPLSYHRTLFLSMAFGFVGDPSLEPGNLDTIQQTFPVMQANGETQQSDQGGSGSPQVDAQKLASVMQLDHTQRGS